MLFMKFTTEGLNKLLMKNNLSHLKNVEYVSDSKTLLSDPVIAEEVWPMFTLNA